MYALQYYTICVYEEPWVWRVKYIIILNISTTWRVIVPNSHVVQVSTLQRVENNKQMESGGSGFITAGVEINKGSRSEWYTG